MIPAIEAVVGHPVEVKGYAQNFDGPIGAMEFSCDGGATWTTYETVGADQSLNVNWSFSFTPEKSGAYELLVRAVTDEGASTPEPAVVRVNVRE